MDTNAENWLASLPDARPNALDRFLIGLASAAADAPARFVFIGVHSWLDP